MYDKALAINTLKNIQTSLDEVLEWCKDVTTVDDFVTSPTGMVLLNAVCMKLLAVGEELKNLDRRTGGELLKNYPAVPWKQVKGLRDVIAHQYFSLDAEIIFSVVNVDIKPILKTITQMMADLKTEN